MFGFGKQKTTHDELGAGLLYLADKLSKAIADRELNSLDSDFSGVDRRQFIHEWTVLMVWAIRCAPIKCDKERLSKSFIKAWFASVGTIRSKAEAQSEWTLIASRVNEYNTVLNFQDSNQMLLGGTIAKNILGQEKICLNAIKAFKMAAHALLLIKEVCEICDKYQITD